MRKACQRGDLPDQRLHEDLHTAAKTKDAMISITKMCLRTRLTHIGAVIFNDASDFPFLSSSFRWKVTIIRRNPPLVLDLPLDEELHSIMETKHKVDSLWMLWS
jgi:hypothetical protein